MCLCCGERRRANTHAAFHGGKRKTVVLREGACCFGPQVSDTEAGQRGQAGAMAAPGCRGIIFGFQLPFSAWFQISGAKVKSYQQEGCIFIVFLPVIKVAGRNCSAAGSVPRCDFGEGIHMVISMFVKIHGCDNLRMGL